MILRDHTGRMIAAKCSARLGCLNPAAAEAIAALEAMVLCCRLGYDRIQFEGNAKLVVEAITTNERIRIGAQKAISLMLWRNKLDLSISGRYHIFPGRQIRLHMF
jgi:ribonuclease HI